VLPLGKERGGGEGRIDFANLVRKSGQRELADAVATASGPPRQDERRERSLSELLAGVIDSGEAVE